jgi:hypothetical protein
MAESQYVNNMVKEACERAGFIPESTSENVPQDVFVSLAIPYLNNKCVHWSLTKMKDDHYVVTGQGSENYVVMQEGGVVTALARLICKL